MTSALNAAWADVIVTTLASRVRHAVVSPGSRHTPLVLALARCPSIETHVVVDERSAAFCALGLARASEAPVALVCTSGSAAAHYAPALIEAHEASTPLVVLSADRPPELQGAAANQTTEQRTFFEGHLRGRLLLEVPESPVPINLSSRIESALHSAVDEPDPGPVHINVPFREPLWSKSDESGPVNASEWHDVEAAPPVPQLEHAIPLLADARRGLIVVGPRSRQDTLSTDRVLQTTVQAFAERRGWPVLVDGTSGIRPDFSATIYGYDTWLGSDELGAALNPDLIVTLGRPLTSKAAQEWLVSSSAKRVHLANAARHRDPRIEADATLIGDPASTLAALESETVTAAEPDWLLRWTRCEQAYGEVSEDDDLFWEGAIARILVEALPENSLLHVGSSMPIRDVDTFSRARGPGVCLTANRGINGIDGTIATALGHALAWRHGLSAALMGDVTFRHDIGSLWIACEKRASLLLVVINNGGGRIFDFLAISDHEEALTRFFTTPFDAAFLDVARAMGARVATASDTPSLRETLHSLLPLDGVRVLEVDCKKCDTAAQHRDFGARVLRRIGAAL